MVAWPTKGASLRELKKRSRTSWSARVRGEHERHLGMRELARHGQQGGIVLSIRIEDHGRGIAA